jgi:hypothetical protein
MHQSVRRAVRAAQFVDIVQRRGRIRADPRDHRRRHPVGAAAPDHIAGVHAVDILHRDEVVGVDLAEVIDLHDVRVAELRGELRLAEEHLDEVGGIGVMRQDALDRDPAIQTIDRAPLCEKHLRHPAARDSALQDVGPERYAAFGSHADILLCNRAQAAVHTGFRFDAAARLRRARRRGAPRAASLMTAPPDDVSRCQTLAASPQRQCA